MGVTDFANLEPGIDGDLYESSSLYDDKCELNGGNKTNSEYCSGQMDLI